MGNDAGLITMIAGFVEHINVLGDAHNSLVRRVKTLERCFTLLQISTFINGLLSLINGNEIKALRVYANNSASTADTRLTMLEERVDQLESNLEQVLQLLADKK